MSWTIRLQRPGDQAILADIYFTVRRQTFDWVDPDAFQRRDFVVHTKGERIFVCEDGDGAIAGFLSLWEPDDFIHMLYIRKERQGTGAGKALLQALPDWPERRYRLKCLVKNIRAKVFYVRSGFKVVGTGSSPEGDYEELILPAGVQF